MAAYDDAIMSTEQQKEQKGPRKLEKTDWVQKGV